MRAWLNVVCNDGVVFDKCEVYRAVNDPTRRVAERVPLPVCHACARACCGRGGQCCFRALIRRLDNLSFIHPCPGILTTVSYSRAITLLTRAGGGSHYSFRFERSVHRGHQPHAKGTSHIRRNHRK